MTWEQLILRSHRLPNPPFAKSDDGERRSSACSVEVCSSPPLLLHSRFGAYVRLGSGEELPLRKVGRDFLNALAPDSPSIPEVSSSSSTAVVTPATCGSLHLSRRVFNPLPSIRLLNESDEKADILATTEFSGPSSFDVGPRVDFYLISRQLESLGHDTRGSADSSKGLDMQSDEDDFDGNNRRDKYQEVTFNKKLEKLDALVPRCCSVWVKISLSKKKLKKSFAAKSKQPHVHVPIEHDSLSSSGRGKPPKQTGTKRLRDGNASDDIQQDNEQVNRIGRITEGEVVGQKRGNQSKKSQNIRKGQQKAKAKKWGRMGWGAFRPFSSDEEEAEDDDDNAATNEGNDETLNEAEVTNDTSSPSPLHEVRVDIGDCMMVGERDEVVQNDRNLIDRIAKNIEFVCDNFSSLMEERLSLMSDGVGLGGYSAGRATVRFLFKMFEDLSCLVVRQCSHHTELTSEGKRGSDDIIAVSLASISYPPLLTIRAFAGGQSSYPISIRGHTCLSSRTRLGIDSRALISRKSPQLAHHLRPYQLEAINRALLLEEESEQKRDRPIRLGGGTRRLGRILLADEMGLGKTLQAIGIVAALNELASIGAAPDNERTDCMYSAIRSPFPVLVVCPASVRPMWAAEAERWLAPFFPSVSTCALSTNANPRQRMNGDLSQSMKGGQEQHTSFGSPHDNSSGSDNEEACGPPAQFVWSVTGHDSKLGVAATPPLVVISRQLVGTLYDIDLAHRNWGTIIVDESHQLHTTLASKEACRTTACVIRLCQSAPYALMLSGTPSLSTPFDMYQQLVGLRPDLFAASPSASPFVPAAGQREIEDNEESKGEACEPEESKYPQKLSPLGSREEAFSDHSLPLTTKEDFGFQFTEALVGHSGGGYLRFGKCQRLAELRSVLDCCFWIRREKKDVAMSSSTSKQLNVENNEEEDSEIGAIGSTKPIEVSSECARDVIDTETVNTNNTATAAEHLSNNKFSSALGPTVRRIVVCVRGNQTVFDEATQYLWAKSKYGGDKNEDDDGVSTSASSGGSRSDDDDEKDGTEDSVDNPEHLGPSDSVSGVASVTTTAAASSPAAMTPYHATGLAKVKALRPLLKMVIKNEIVSSSKAFTNTGNINGKPRLVLFAHHIDVLDVMQEMASRIVDGVDGLSSSEIVRRIDGSTPMPTRELILNQFQDSRHSVQILVAAVTACGVGVHQMAGASAAVFCELPPNISWLLQAEGRVARPRAQTNSSDNNSNDAVVGNSQNELCRVYVCVADNLRVDRRLWARLQRGFHDVATIMASSSPSGVGGAASQSEGKTPSKDAKEQADALSDDSFVWVGETRGPMAFRQQLSFTLRRQGFICARLGFRLGQHTELVQIIAEMNDAASQRSDPHKSRFVLVASENKNACVELAVDAMKNSHDADAGCDGSLYAVVDGLRTFLASIGLGVGGDLKTPPPSSGSFSSAAFDASTPGFGLTQTPASTLPSSRILSSQEIRQRRLSGKVEWCQSLHFVSSHDANAPKTCTSLSTLFLPLDSDDNNSQSLSMVPFTQTDPAPRMLKSNLFSVSKPWDTTELYTNESRELQMQTRTSRPPRYANTRYLPPTVSDRAVVATWRPSSPPEHAGDRAHSPKSDCKSVGDGVVDDVVGPLPLPPPPPQCVYVLLKVPVTVGGERLETKHLAIAERTVGGDCEQHLRLRCLQCRKGPALPLLQDISELRDTDNAAELAKGDTALECFGGVREVLWSSVAPAVATQFEITSSPYLYLFCSGACKASYFIVRSGTAIRRALGAHDKGICNHCQLDGDALLAELQSVSSSSSHFHGTFSSGSVLTKAPRKAKENSEVEARRKEIILMRQPEFAHHPVLLRRLACQPTAGNVWHADHRRPVRAGGGLAGLDNLQTLCVVCHAAKTRLEERRYSAHK